MSSPSPAGPRPLHYLFVAGLGRRVIGPPDTLHAALVETLKRIAAAAPDAQPVAMSSGAAGADQVFLEAARSLGWPLRIVLPLPIYLFEQDFTNSDDATPVEKAAGLAALTAFKSLCAVATEIEIISPSPTRRMAFTRCANTLVTEADLVVALWDGQPGNPGGTNESLLLARQLDVPLLTLDARTGAPFTNQAQPQAEDLLVRYRKRHERGALRDVDSALAAVPATAPLKTLLKDSAADLSRSYKNKCIGAIGIHVLASGLALLMLVSHQTKAIANTVVVVKVLAVAFAVWIVSNVKSRKEHLRWAKTRFIREILRSMHASAPIARHCGEPLARFVPTSIWAMSSHLKRPLLFHVLGEHGSTAKEDLRTALGHYREHLCVQIAYQEDAGHEAHFYHRVIDCFFWLSTIAFAVLCAMGLGLKNHDGLAYQYVKWLTVFLPVISAALLVLPNLWDIHRRRRVAPRLAETLKRLDSEAAEVEQILADSAVGIAPTLGGKFGETPVWSGLPAEQQAATEAWARSRTAAIVREAEHAMLTELIGFKTFVENAEAG